MEQQQQRLKQQQAMMQQVLLHQQQHSLYPHPGLVAAPQIEPIPSGNLPPGFDSSTCCSVYVGNIHVQVTEALLQEVFHRTGLVEGCKLIRKDKICSTCHYDFQWEAFVWQPIKVNWAYASGQREDTSGHYNIFVGDLSPEVTDATLFALFSVYSSCSDARVMWDQKTAHSRGFGFVSFRNKQAAGCTKCHKELNCYFFETWVNMLRIYGKELQFHLSKWLGSRQIRCNWATKGADANGDKQNSDTKSMAELANRSTEDGRDYRNDEGPENNPKHRTVYVGNLAPEVTQVDLHRHFHNLGAGAIEEVRIQREKGFGFVRYSNHLEAALAIQVGNAQTLLWEAN